MGTSQRTLDPLPLEGPPVDVSDPRELLLGYLEWYREAMFRKISGLSETDLRVPLEPLGWAPLGLVKHLGWVELRWMRWGFAAEEVQAYPLGGEAAEWAVSTQESSQQILDGYLGEVAHSRALASGAALTEVAAVGGRFDTAAQTPSLGRILFHLLQEYARHVGQLDVARELIDGVTGE